MNWLYLVIGVVLGGAGQRLLHQRQRSPRGLNSPQALKDSIAETSAKLSAKTSDAAVGASPVFPLGNAAPEHATAGASMTSAMASDLTTVDVAKRPPAEPEASKPSEEADKNAAQRIADPFLWLAYVRALERAQFQGGFLARAAHELRSPLSSLMGLQQLILTDLCDSPEEERQCVAQSYEATQNLHRLMDQLIRVAKLEQGSQQLDIQAMDLSVLLEDVESFVYLQLADRNCRLHLSQPTLPVYAKGDYNSLRQVLVMLVELALAQQASEIDLAIDLALVPGESATTKPGVAAPSGITVCLRSDKPWVPTAEQQNQLEAGRWEDSWGKAKLADLKQSLAQDPEASFVPHRLAPGMVLLISQLILDLNGGCLRLGEVSSPSATSSGATADAQDEAESGPAALNPAESGLKSHQGYSLELSLPTGMADSPS